MTRRSLIVDLTTRRSLIVDIESCGGCGAPFAAVDRSALRPVRVRSHLTRNRLAFALQCSCGRVSIVFDAGDGELALVPDDYIHPTDGPDRAH